MNLDKDVFCRLGALEVLGKESPGHKVWPWIIGEAKAESLYDTAQKQCQGISNASWALRYGTNLSGKRADTFDLQVRLKQYEYATTLCGLASRDVWSDETFSLAEHCINCSRKFPVLVTGLPDPAKILASLSYLHDHVEQQRLNLLRTPEAELIPLGMLWLWRARGLPDEWAVRDWAKFHGVPKWAL